MTMFGKDPEEARQDAIGLWLLLGPIALLLFIAGIVSWFLE